MKRGIYNLKMQKALSKIKERNRPKKISSVYKTKGKKKKIKQSKQKIIWIIMESSVSEDSQCHNYLHWCFAGSILQTAGLASALKHIKARAWNR